MTAKRQAPIRIHAIRKGGNFVFLCNMFAIVDMEDSMEICFSPKKIPVYEIKDYTLEYNDNETVKYSAGGVSGFLLKLLHKIPNRVSWLHKFERAKNFSYNESDHTTGMFGFFETPHHEISKMNIAFEKIKQTITFILDAYYQEYD
jgi:hypothetical protein